MSNRDKGSQLERKAIAQLEAEGFLVHRTISTPIWAGNRVVGSRSNDVFGVFDLVAAHPTKGLRFIQVTDSGHVAARRDKVAGAAPSFPATCRIEVWGWVGGAKRYDPRFKTERRFIRRQYFRQFVWTGTLDENFEYRWRDATDPQAGWVDQAPPAPSARGALDAGAPAEA